MHGLKLFSSKYPRPVQIISTYFYLTAGEFASIFLYYLISYQKADWWSHPTLRGSAILFGLFFSALASVGLGHYYRGHPQKAYNVSNQLAKPNIFTLLFIFSILIIILLVLINYIPYVILSSPVLIFRKHPALSILLLLFTIQSMSMLVYLRIKESSSSILPIYKKNWFHFIIWGGMVLYFIIGPGLYSHFILLNGKPLEMSQELPEITDQIKYSIGSLDLIKSHGQELYNLSGWSFFVGDPDQSSYSRFIVLQSNKETYYFSLDDVERPGVQETFKDLNMDLLKSGFTSKISKDAIQTGKYQVGILFKHQSDNLDYYIITIKILLRTANHLILQ